MSETWLVKTLKKTPEYGTYFLLIVIGLDAVISGVLKISFLQKFIEYFELEINDDYRIGIIYVLVILVATNFTFQFRNISKGLSQLNNNYHGVMEVLEPNMGVDYKELLTSHKTVKILTLSGSVTGKFGSDEIIEIFRNKNRNSKVIILIANPFSKSIVNRYKYDEPENYEAGVEVIKRRILLLRDIKKELSDGANKKFVVKVFNNYPTISITQADSDIYSSVYGFKLRGNDCPTIHAQTGIGYGIFLEKHFKKVFKDADDIEIWYKKNLTTLNGEQSHNI